MKGASSEGESWKNVKKEVVRRGEREGAHQNSVGFDLTAYASRVRWQTFPGK